jgi:dienelactone hydrolase
VAEGDGLRNALRERFEIGRHPLSFEAAGEGRIRFRTAKGEPVDGYLIEPGGPGGRPAPAILYIHAHGNRYDIGAAEVVDGREQQAGPVGPALAAAGFRVLALDMPCFGGRAALQEGAESKAAQWRGGSLAGRMLGELGSALDWLAADPGTDPGRIGVFGLSMGATLGYWLAAVEPRVAAVAHLCCFADFGPMVESGAHDLHGHYLTVPGLLNVASNGEIAGLIAPRAQFVGIGEADGLTPPYALEPALATLTAAYRARGAEGALRVHREPGRGHEETPAMRRAMLDFFAAALG